LFTYAAVTVTRGTGPATPTPLHLADSFQSTLPACGWPFLIANG